MRLILNSRECVPYFKRHYRNSIINGKTYVLIFYQKTERPLFGKRPARHVYVLLSYYGGDDHFYFIPAMMFNIFFSRLANYIKIETHQSDVVVLDKIINYILYTRIICLRLSDFQPFYRGAYLHIYIIYATMNEIKNET